MDHSIEAALELDGDAERITDFYAGWAESYDADVGGDDYHVADVIVEVLLEGADGRFDGNEATTTVLDAGCGTGLVGVSLARRGFTEVHGVDLSPEMVEVARTRDVYVTLEGDVDLMQPPTPERERAYDVMFVAGVFTYGHVGPEYVVHMGGFVKPGGLLAISARAAYHAESDYDAVVARSIAAGDLTLVAERRDAPYTPDSTGHYFVYEVS